VNHIKGKVRRGVYGVCQREVLSPLLIGDAIVSVGRVTMWKKFPLHIQINQIFSYNLFVRKKDNDWHAICVVHCNRRLRLVCVHDDEERAHSIGKHEDGQRWPCDM
jgi:hypothetical protein